MFEESRFNGSGYLDTSWLCVHSRRCIPIIMGVGAHLGLLHYRADQSATPAKDSTPRLGGCVSRGRINGPQHWVLPTNRNWIYAIMWRWHSTCKDRLPPANHKDGWPQGGTKTQSYLEQRSLVHTEKIHIHQHMHYLGLAQVCEEGNAENDQYVSTGDKPSNMGNRCLHSLWNCFRCEYGRLRNRKITIMLQIKEVNSSRTCQEH